MNYFEWIEKPLTYEDWRTQEIVGIRRYWALVDEIGGPPFVYDLHQVLIEWLAFNPVA